MSSTCTHRGESGTGLIGSLSGLLVVSAMLALAVQVTTDLAVASSVSAAGHDAVRRVASHAVDHDDPTGLAIAQHRAQATVEQHLLGPHAPQLRWAVHDGWVHLTIAVDRPRVAPAAVSSLLGPRTVERTFRARLERP